MKNILDSSSILINIFDYIHFVFVPDIDVEALSEKLLLPVQDVKWHLDHYRNIVEKRKARAQKSREKRGQKNNSILGISTIYYISLIFNITYISTYTITSNYSLVFFHCQSMFMNITSV